MTSRRLMYRQEVILTLLIQEGSCEMVQNGGESSRVRSINHAYIWQIGQGSTNTFGLAWVWKVSASQEE